MNTAMQKLIDSIRSADTSSFYRNLWGDAHSFEMLPSVSRKNFLDAPLSQRRYKNEKGLVKIVRDTAGAFLSEWSFADIAAEEYGRITKRPMVFLSDPHEAIEKSMWCYERNMVPLIGERDQGIAMHAAAKYEIDSLIADETTLPKAASYIRGTRPLESISILGSEFNVQELMQFADLAKKVRLVLSLPETGALAEALLSTSPSFSPLDGCIIEAEEKLVVSKARLLATPIIKYRTEIPAQVYDGAR